APRDTAQDASLRRDAFGSSSSTRSQLRRGRKPPPRRTVFSHVGRVFGVWVLVPKSALPQRSRSQQVLQFGESSFPISWTTIHRPSESARLAISSRSMAAFGIRTPASRRTLHKSELLRPDRRLGAGGR